jgi:hypothetical protein
LICSSSFSLASDAIRRGVGLGGFDHAGGLTLGFFPLGLHVGEQGLGLFTQLLGFVEFGLDLGGMRVEGREQGARQDLEHDQQADEQGQARPGPTARGWRDEEGLRVPSSSLLTPASPLSSAAEAALPVSFSTMAPAVSEATARTWLMASSRAAWMRPRRRQLFSQHRLFLRLTLGGRGRSLGLGVRRGLLGLGASLGHLGAAARA